MFDFTILNQEFQFKPAEIVSLFQYKKSEYILYFINTFDKEDYKLLLSKCLKSDDGHYKLEAITNSIEKEEVLSKIKNMLGGKNE